MIMPRASDQLLLPANPLFIALTLLLAFAINLVPLDIVPDEENPQATLSAHDEAGELLAEIKVPPSFKLNRASAVAWAESHFSPPAGR